MPVAPEARPPPETRVAAVPHRRRDRLGPPPIAGSDPIRAHSQPAEHIRIAEIGQTRRLIGRQQHVYERQGTPGSQQVGFPQGAVAPGLDGLGDRVLR